MASRLFIEPTGSDGYTTPITAEDAWHCRTFSPQRRREWLAWRAIVRRELGQDVAISYNPTGAPQVDHKGIYIGVSHSRRSVAVTISDHPTAVDIETPDRNFAGIASKFLSEEEQARFAGDRLMLGAAWCAKECVYKLHSSRFGNLSLRDDIEIREISLDRMRITGGIKGENPTEFFLHYGDEIIVYI